MSVKEAIIAFLRGQNGCVATLKQIYKGISENGCQPGGQTPENTVRARLYEDRDTFRRVCKGVYMLTGSDTDSVSLLIEGDGRNLTEIEDSSIDCIITDHPWSDAKANKGGNRHFADYDCFQYEERDFAAKARVLKEGSYLAEFLPVESATNWKYLFRIKEMAEKNGLEYYTQILWRNSYNSNCGRVSKGVQNILIFTKGKPRKLSPDNVQGYQTAEMLKYEVEMLINPKTRRHQAEKPVALYEYLIRQFTKPGDVCLDQFGGSCNMLKAAQNTKRHGIVYEICHSFVEEAKKFFGLVTLHEDAAAEPSESENPVFFADADGQLSFCL